MYLGIPLRNRWESAYMCKSASRRVGDVRGSGCVHSILTIVNVLWLRGRSLFATVSWDRELDLCVRV